MERELLHHLPVERKEFSILGSLQEPFSPTRDKDLREGTSSRGSEE